MSMFVMVFIHIIWENVYTITVNKWRKRIPFFISKGLHLTQFTTSTNLRTSPPLQKEKNQYSRGLCILFTSLDFALRFTLNDDEKHFFSQGSIEVHFGWMELFFFLFWFLASLWFSVLFLRILVIQWIVNWVPEFVFQCWNFSFKWG